MTFRTIPGTLGFKISEDGTLQNAVGAIRNTYKNGDGYITAAVQLLDENATWRTFGLHRLVALAQLPCPGDPVDYEVNHKDKNIENNHKSNLEWVTRAENNTHAALFGHSGERPLLLAFDPQNRPLFFKDLSEAANRIGRNTFELWNAVLTQTAIDGWTLHHFTTKTRIPRELQKGRIIARDSSGRQPEKAILVRDVQTDQVHPYGSMAEAAREHGVSTSHVYQCLSIAGHPRLFKGRYLIVLEGQSFPTVTPSMIEEMKSPGGKEVWGFNEVTGAYLLTSSASSFVKETGLSKKAVTTALKADRLRKVGDWWFLYKTSANIKQLKEIADRPQS